MLVIWATVFRTHNSEQMLKVIMMVVTMTKEREIINLTFPSLKVSFVSSSFYRLTNSGSRHWAMAFLMSDTRLGADHLCSRYFTLVVLCLKRVALRITQKFVIYSVCLAGHRSKSMKCAPSLVSEHSPKTCCYCWHPVYLQ